MPTTRARRSALALATLGVAGVLSLAGAEAVLRVLRPQAVGVSRLPLVYEPDPALGYRYRPGATGRIQRLFEIDRTVHVNALGHHDVERDPGFGGPLVLALGDSFTAALHVPPEASWPHRLEGALRARVDPGLQLWNLGLDGTGTDVQVALLREELARRAPRAVLLAFYANDVLDVARGPVRRVVHRGYVLQPQGASQEQAMRALVDRVASPSPLRWGFEHLYLVRLGVFLAAGDRNLYRTNVVGPSHLGAASPALDPRPGVRLQRAWTELASLARAHGFAWWVVAIPDRDEPERTARILSSQVGLDVIDPLPAMREALTSAGGEWRDLYWHFDGHLNARGHELLAGALAPRLAEALAPALAPRLAPALGAEE